MRAIPNPLYGATLDNIANVKNIVAGTKALCRMPTYRVVFDEAQSATYYTSALTTLQPIAYLMGEVLDSQYVKTFSVSQYTSRVASYLSTLGNLVDIWEIGNEVNGNWLGTTSDVVSKITNAYNQVKAASKKASITFYYDPTDTSSYSMFTWIKANMSTTIKNGLDYALISYYECDCNNIRPSLSQWTSIFQQLQSLFPNAKIGFGEIGYDNQITSSQLTAAQNLMTYYYSLPITLASYVGGCFWWYYYEDCLPCLTQPLWTTFNNILPKVV